MKWQTAGLAQREQSLVERSAKYTRYNPSHPVSTKIEHSQVQQKERTEKVLEHRLIYPKFAVPWLWPYASL